MTDYDPSSWTCSSNEALHVSLALPDRALTFHPEFTYPIFGDSEQIFGYKDLTLNLAFDCESLKPFIGTKYSEKLSNEVKSLDEELLKYLPKEDTIVQDEIKWLDSVDEEKFEKPGEVIYTYDGYGEDRDYKFEVRKFKLTKDREGLKLHRRIQIFVLLFIEAGSYIDESDPTWDVYVIYQVPKNAKSKSVFVGFTTVYSYWKYLGGLKHDELVVVNDELKLQFRKKISQFIILPPFQGKGHGRNLYKTIFDEFLKDQQVEEVTIEDPSESFDDLRDRCDLERLNERKFLAKLSKLPLTSDWLDSVRLVEKMDKRQFERCVEMSLLNEKNANSFKIDQLNEKQIRLQIKKRIYLKNKDALDELEKADKMDKLQVAYERLKEDYLRILEKVDFSKKRVVDDNDNLVNKASIKIAKVEDVPDAGN